jgi:glucose-1-phosphate thymidylyltransferase
VSARELVGLIPAAGRAARLGPGGASKEILPIGWRGSGEDRTPILACESLLGALRAAGCARGVVLRRAEKRDIEAALGDGARFGLPLEYLVVPATRSVPETLSFALPHLGSADLALGFPDVLAEPADGLARAVAHRRSSGADAVLALFPTDRPHKCDMVEAGSDGRVRRIEVKPARTQLSLTWLFATWGTRLSALLLAMVANERRFERELTMSDVLLASIAMGHRVEAVSFPDGSHLDVGTPDDLERARSAAANR